MSFADFSLEQRLSLAPFLSRKILDELAAKAEAVEGMGELCGRAFFVSPAILAGLAGQVKAKVWLVSKKAGCALVRRVPL